MNREQVIVELNEARRLWSSRTTITPELMLRIIRGLALVLFRAPDDMVYMVRAHIMEAERRLFYLEVGK